MLRAVTIGLAMLLALQSTAALAGEASANFTVGLVIGGPKVRGLRPAPGPKASYTWNAAAISVRLAGFRKPVRLGAAAGVYWFAAERGGERFRVAISIATGAVLKVVRRA